MATTLAILQVIAALAGLLREFFVVKQSADDRQAGRSEAERDQSEMSRKATERELEASLSAPQSADEAIRRLEEGSA